MIAKSIAIQDYYWATIFAAFEALAITMLYKTTNNYIAHKKQIEPSTGSDSD